MSVTILQLTPHDPIIARDGRPFGAGQGNRMRGLGWPLPSVVAGSLRTALVKANSDLEFTGDTPQQLLKAIEVAGVFPTADRELYLPAPHDCVWDDKTNKVHRIRPIPLEQDEGADFPPGDLAAVGLTKKQAEDDFKAKAVPAWWPKKRYEEWLASPNIEYTPAWFDSRFLAAAKIETRDHVSLDADRGAAADGQLFATAGLNVAHLPRFFPQERSSEQRPKTFRERFAEVQLTARVTVSDPRFGKLDRLDTWHPLGGERRLVHWQRSDMADLWKCPNEVASALGNESGIRMILATPAVFKHGWRPDWLMEGRSPPGSKVKLKLVGASIGRWRAVSGWSLASPIGPKRIRRMVPAGGVYFFQVEDGNAAELAERWLQSVSDDAQDQRDGFGLAVWGTWKPNK